MAVTTAFSTALPFPSSVAHVTAGSCPASTSMSARAFAASRSATPVFPRMAASALFSTATASTLPSPMTHPLGRPFTRASLLIITARA